MLFLFFWLGDGFKLLVKALIEVIEHVEVIKHIEQIKHVERIKHVETVETVKTLYFETVKYNMGSGVSQTDYDNLRQQYEACKNAPAPTCPECPKCQECPKTQSCPKCQTCDYSNYVKKSECQKCSDDKDVSAELEQLRKVSNIYKGCDATGEECDENKSYSKIAENLTKTTTERDDLSKRLEQATKDNAYILAKYKKATGKESFNFNADTSTIRIIAYIIVAICSAVILYCAYHDAHLSFQTNTNNVYHS